MRRTGLAVAMTTALGLFAATAYAQQPGNSGKPANQVHDQGVDDDDKAAQGTARKGPAERVVSQVAVTVQANGAAVAELDEAFDEAIVVTINPDGTRSYEAVQGLAAAAERVQMERKPTTPQPALEEK